MFKIKEHRSNAALEISAGLAIFCAMVYVLAANPAILSTADPSVPADAIFTATCCAAIVGCVLMALVANVPFAVAPGMGINAIFGFVVIKTQGYSWNQALAATFIAGLIFFLLSLSPLREKILRDIPRSIQYAVCGGVGLLIAGIGLINSQTVIFTHGLPALGNFHQPQVQLTLIGLFLTAIMLALRFRYAVLAGIILSTLVGLPLGVTQLPSPEKLLTLPPSLKALNFDFSPIGSLDFWSAVLVFIFLAIFDSLAAFLGLFSIMGEKEAEEYKPKLGRAFIADSLAMVSSALLGTSPNTAYGESGTGIALGGRTGLTALVCGLCFVLALFCAPIFLAIPFAAVAPALVVVGWYMLSPLTKIDFHEPTESFPAIVALALIGLSWKISDGLAIAWLVYVTMKLVSGRGRDLNPTVYVVALIFAGKLLWEILL